MQTLRIQTPPARLPLSSANEDIPSKGPSLFPLRLQRFNRFGLCNSLCENQPSLSRRLKLFAMPPVAYGLSHFAVADFPAIHSRESRPWRAWQIVKAALQRECRKQTAKHLIWPGRESTSTRGSPKRPIFSVFRAQATAALLCRRFRVSV